MHIYYRLNKTSIFPNASLIRGFHQMIVLPDVLIFQDDQVRDEYTGLAHISSIHKAFHCRC